MAQLPGAGGVVPDLAPIDYSLEKSTETATSPRDALTVFGDAIGDISTVRADIATQKLRLLDEQQKLEEEAAKQKILEDAKSNKIVADNSAALLANDALVRLSKIANSSATELSAWQEGTVPGIVAAKALEAGLLGFTEGFSGVKLKSHEQQLQEKFSSATTQIGTINASLNAIKSGAEATKHVVAEATLQRNLRLASNLLNTKTLDERDAILATNATVIKAMSDGMKPAMEALSTWHNEGFAERQFQTMREERTKDNLRADQEFNFRKEETARDNARQDEASTRANKSFDLRLLNESQDTIARLQKENAEIEKQKTMEDRISTYRSVIERVGARINLPENPTNALLMLDTMRKSKNPEHRRTVEALDTYVIGLVDQKNAGFASMQHYDVHGYTPWEAMLNDTMFPFPGMHPEEKEVINFQKRQLDMMQIPQPKIVTTTGPNGEIKTAKSSIMEAPLASAKNDTERAFIYNNELDKRAREMLLNPEVGGKDNIYAPPSLGSLESLGRIAGTRFFQDVLKPQIAAGETKFEASDIVDKAIAARDAGIIAPKELAPTLSLIFGGIVTQNNVVKNYVGHGLPAQTAYAATLEHPVTGKFIRYNLHDTSSLEAYIAVKEYERNRSWVKKYAYDATGVHKDWLNNTGSDAAREAAGLEE